jgi:anionic cell wall polymer biosynthesis LytR-Cps2A-Psr (LCP) family protein
VQSEDRTAVASALLASDPDVDTAAALLVPQQVLINVPGIGSLPLGRALSSAPPHGSRDGLSDLMGVTVDEGWVLPSAQLAQLIDLVGGISVEVDVPVVADSTVLLDVGPQRVDGARALQLMQYLAPEEQEQSRLARMQEVLDGLLSSLPAKRTELVSLLEGLGVQSDSTLSSAALADFLMAMNAADTAGQLQYDSLPVLPIDTGGGVTAFRVDAPKINAVVDRLLADSVPPGVREGGNRVLVLNGVGTPGLGEAVRAKLAPAGFVFVGSRNAPEFGHAKTQVLVPRVTAEAQALGARVAQAIGVPPTNVFTQEFGTVADVVVLVGADFKP